YLINTVAHRRPALGHVARDSLATAHRLGQLAPAADLFELSFPAHAIRSDYSHADRWLHAPPPLSAIQLVASALLTPVSVLILEHAQAAGDWGKERKMAPHMTHFRMRARAGERQKVIDRFDLGQRGRRHEAAGFVRLVLCSNVDDAGESMGWARCAGKQ